MKTGTFPASRRRWKAWGILLAMIAPTLLGTLLFSYYPNAEVFVRMFYKWEPANNVVEFTGLDNLSRMFADARFWSSFKLALILLAANTIKMVPSIFAAVVLHRLKSDRLRYTCQVLFVMPMVVPMLVWLLMWKNFFDPTVGIINKALNASGGMNLLQFLDAHMWRLADNLYPVTYWLDVFLKAGGPPEASPDLGARVAGWGVWAFLAFGALTATLAGDWRDYRHKWPLLAFLALPILAIAQWKALYLLPLAYLVSRTGARTNPFQTANPGRNRGYWILAVAGALILLTRIWTTETGAFQHGNPVWLGHTALVVPALILWGFPWIFTMGVLIYLAGLQNIGEEIYEAGRLDGLSSWGRFRYIEFPLILGQIRVILILMTITSLVDYGNLLLLLGPEGGPAGVGMVPGLYMYNQAFKQGAYGYACALGVMLFCMIMVITIIYQRYVRVEK